MFSGKSSLILFVFLGVVTGQDCDNVCYKEIKNGLKYLEEVYGKPPNVSNIPPMFTNITALINRTENVTSNIRNLQEVKNKSLSVPHILDKTTKRINLLKNIITEIDTINKTLQDLQRKQEKRNNAFNECEEANKLYQTLTEDVDNMKDYGNKVSAAFEGILKRIEEIRKQSLDVKRDLDEIHISDDLFQSYLCNSRLLKTLEDIISIMKSIADTLKSSFAEIFNSKLKELENNITKYEEFAKEMENSLNERLPESDLKITSGTRPLLEDLKEQVNDLKNKLKDIKLDKSFDEILQDAKKKLKDLINEYETILNQIFSKETKDKVIEEIEKAKETLRLLKERDALRAELEDLKKIVDTLKDRGVCFIKEKVSVEDKS